MKRVCVFCGANPGLNPAFSEAARAMGRAIAERGLGLVYGGGHVGLMGIVADAAMQAGAEVIGIIPEVLMRREVGHGAITQLHVVSSMHERKKMMADLSDGFVVLPGGVGTLEEAVEAFTWTQLGIHEKGLVFLDTDGYWQRMSGLLDHMVAEGFVKPEQRPIASFTADPMQALDLLAAFRAPPAKSWASPDQR
ncbi:LOG family protein [Roseomonas marmotae]|uniref:Cytokinin riboside 5'-monophosphate phosphoribohydrolase n=1 Tax=Roseomonas marmotae TaxID=2768161 RepID=A0ABS3K8V1_9PROT|nr:TIGR00730 family Rossman fold protein [Roseomonas marmotae]MBO1073442.1 TIGR00730 family Rossman fold protein [Roseomonas marmotae]QTI80362.1 TIGR00730 family Rossman fold protein [Roseomonas marmotae]